MLFLLEAVVQEQKGMAQGLKLEMASGRDNNRRMCFEVELQKGREQPDMGK